MSPLTPRETVEVFHLEFVRVLAATQAKYAIKGGCNLRFFFGSVRYSDDLDLDVTVTAKGTLEKQVDKILKSRPLAHLLKIHGIKIAQISKPKQTDTTQRWKVALETEQYSNINTKIEFSRRPSYSAVEGPIDVAVAERYRLSRTNARHYDSTEAIAQKVEALVGRREVQARDVFDLNLLLSSSQNEDCFDSLVARGVDLKAAANRAMEISYEQYAARVVAYLVPEHVEIYGTRAAWEAMRSRVVDFLLQGER